MISIKIHESYRRVAAIADLDLIGKKFEEENRQLDVRENFYKGSEFSEEEAVSQIKRHVMEDATFNIVGEKSIKASIEAGLIDQESVSEIAGIPFALKLI